MLSLDLVKGGSRVVVKTIQSNGKGIVGRLYHMGILPGEKIEVISNKGHGPIIVKIKETEIALGRGLARRIFVEVINDG